MNRLTPTYTFWSIIAEPDSRRSGIAGKLLVGCEG
jgi:hypothetical protein